MVRHLNVSMNPSCAGHLEYLFSECCKWNDLLSLNAKQQYIDHISEKRSLFSQDSEFIMSKGESACLSSLKEISLTVYSPQYFTTRVTTPWQHLKSINISASFSKPFRDHVRFTGSLIRDTTDHPVLQPLYDMVSKNLLPALQEIRIVTQICTPRSITSIAADKYNFSKNNICLNIFQGVTNFT